MSLRPPPSFCRNEVLLHEALGLSSRHSVFSQIHTEIHTYVSLLRALSRCVIATHRHTFSMYAHKSLRFMVSSHPRVKKGSYCEV